MAKALVFEVLLGALMIRLKSLGLVRYNVVVTKQLTVS